MRGIVSLAAVLSVLKLLPNSTLFFGRSASMRHPREDAHLLSSSGSEGGINADKTTRSLTLNLSFLNGRAGIILEDAAHNQVVQKPMAGSARQTVILQPQGDFVVVFE